MSIENVRQYLRAWNKDNEIIEFPVSSATVELAAKALNTEQARIAKSLSFMIDSKAILVITAGDVKIDNKKYKKEFGTKAKMLLPYQVNELLGHEIGGVCPFGIPNNIDVYLDISLKRFDFVYPACGSSNSAIKLSCEELKEISKSKKWIDVCKDKK